MTDGDLIKEMNTFAAYLRQQVANGKKENWEIHAEMGRYAFSALRRQRIAKNTNKGKVNEPHRPDEKRTERAKRQYQGVKRIPDR